MSEKVHKLLKQYSELTDDERRIVAEKVSINSQEHFEDIWNDAEKLGEQIDPFSNISKHVLQIRKHANELNNKITLDEKNNEFGELLYNLCQVARLLPINSAESLRRIIRGKKV